MAGVSETHRQVFNAIREILLREWDPIGVGEEPSAQDEYDSYIPEIYRLINNGAGVDEIAARLEQIESTQMGLSPNAERGLIAALRLSRVVGPG